MGKLFDIIKANKVIFGILSVVGAGVVGWLAFFFFEIQAAFTDDVASEEEIAANQDLLDSFLDDEEADLDEEADAEDGEVDSEEAGEETSDTTVDSETEETEESDEESDAETTATTAEEQTETTEAPTTEAEAQPVSGSGTFSGTPTYDSAGSAMILSNDQETRVFLLDDFVTDNGPDLKVYLRADDGSFVSLGDLQNNVGSSNYLVPEGTDLSVFSTVEIWCERFGGRFGAAPISFA